MKIKLSNFFTEDLSVFFGWFEKVSTVVNDMEIRYNRTRIEKMIYNQNVYEGEELKFLEGE